ncbi:putative serine acetyltransferase [Microlunatus phosphovorus NM-1]|uniref:Serine acetyltransferase n=1 Tax=Microlunatus phosphovorus (strain ATCC 700054 / DSM 10555 / JCM 9379 / NBRC 101784 / NCIMB 13414 / VKM Ac-1990 / NM-1) TaxID=1032480 RepID=F5XFD7_MICPN|nr:serine acetyltransferase [Microlunatus phosphovorus]BAK37875.1 putative serine acetyltransferase [Microlunatus phosphovorus NM-1]
MGNFAVDLDKIYTVKLKTHHPSLQARLGLLLLNSELHCLACYRYGQFADALRARNRFLGTLAVVTHRTWNRWVTNLHHVDISRKAKIGPGLLIMHRHGIVLGPSQIGSNCLIHQNVTIGQRIAAGDQGVPVIGDNVWIGPGAIITGAIVVGDGAVISAGTVLSKDVPPGSLVGGNPGRVITRDYDTGGMMSYSIPPELLP